MLDVNPTIAIITLNFSHLKAPTEGQRLLEWIKIHDPTPCCYKKSTLNIKTHIDQK